MTPRRSRTTSPRSSGLAEMRLGADFVTAHFGDLRPVHHLGTGGFGEVWRVERDGVDVVLKLLRPDAPARRWRRERDALTAVRSERVPSLLGAGTLPSEEGPVRWILQDLVDGPSVRTQIRAGIYPSPSELRGMGRRLLQAVRDVHAAGFIFRDVSPGNVVLDQSEWTRPFLVDLGLAVRQDAPERTLQNRAGTRAYKAPEQLRREPVVPATDLFAVGVVCYKLAAEGRHPFVGKGEKLTAREANVRIASGPPRLPKEHQFNERWIRRLLAYEPTDRVLTRREVRHAPR